jgi:hypothetical protein
MNMDFRSLAACASGAWVGMRPEIAMTTVITITTRTRGGCG